MVLLNGKDRVMLGFPLIKMTVEALKANIELDLSTGTWVKAVET